MRIWIDCTAAAHPLVLRPIAERLVAAGHEVEWTAREYGQLLGILERLGIEHTVVGEHGGARMAGKGWALAGRSARLWRWARERRIDLALAHGSVDIALVSRVRRLPLVQMNDYEHAGRQRRIAFRAARLVMAPDAIPLEALERAGARRDRLFLYPGLKEDYYLADFSPDPAVLEELEIMGDPVIVVVRPPPETSEYHAENELYDRVIERLGGLPLTVAVVLPRTEEQARRLRDRGAPSLTVPDHAIDAQSLIAYADLTVSAGGTMNREAVALGTPAYSIFSGDLGAVDRRLIEEGRLRQLTDPSQLELRKREAPTRAQQPRDPQILADAVLSAVGRPQPVPE
jgi:predicted glycosyltransferase